MSSEEFKNELLRQSINLINVPNKILEQLNKSILILTKLSVKKLFIEYDKYNECIVIWLNLYNQILVNINVDEDPICTFSIFHNGELLVMDELKLIDLIEKLKLIQDKLNADIYRKQ